MTRSYTFRWWTKGDLDGFFGLFVDNLIQLILIVVLSTNLLGLPGDLVFGRILPAVALSLLFGNIYYAFQARKLSIKTGKTATALPYGVNTVSLFAYIIFVMKPVMDRTQDADLAWAVGLAACFGSGVIEILGSFVAKWIRKVTPRAALLATLGGIAIVFISLDFCFKIFNDPLIGFAPLAIIFIQYIGKKKLPGNIPAGLVAVILGTSLAWIFGRLNPQDLASSAEINLHLPTLVLPQLWSAITSEYMLEFLPVIIPMGLFNLLGSLQNLESAEAAGDVYSEKSSLIINGAGTILASFFGSVFPTTIYIGHPGWKGMGAGAGYSVANGVVISLLCFLGLVSFSAILIPIEAGAAILLWIGITIASQAFQSTPREHAPAVVVGFFPALAAWGLIMIEGTLRSVSQNIGSVGLPNLANAGISIHGLISMERGFIFTSMILAAFTVFVIEKNFFKAALWSLVAALISMTGLMHGYTISKSGAVINAYGPQHTWEFVVGYSVISIIFLTMHFYIQHYNNPVLKKNKIRS